MKKTPSLVLCAAAAGAVVALSSCKPSQPVVENAATPVPTATAAPAASAPAAAPAAATSAGIDLKDPVATVDGDPITKAQLDDAFNNTVQASGVKVADLSDAQKLEGYHQLLDELRGLRDLRKAAAEQVKLDEPQRAM